MFSVIYILWQLLMLPFLSVSIYGTDVCMWTCLLQFLDVYLDANNGMHAFVGPYLHDCGQDFIAVFVDKALYFMC